MPVANIRFDNGDQITTPAGNERVPCLSDPAGGREDKWIDARTIAGARNLVTALSVVSGVVTVDCSLGDYFVLVPTAIVTSWVFTNVPAACSPMIRMSQGATPYAVAMPAGLKWVGGVAGVFSTAANARDRLAMTTDDGGTTWDATLAKAFA